MTHDAQDVVIIGGGPGGYVAAIRAAQLGMNVALVEKEHLGGVCVNWGCIPTKALLRNAEVIGLLGEGRTFGFELEGFRADYGAAVKRSRRVSGRLARGVAALLRENGVQVLDGTGRISAPGRVEVVLADGGELGLQARAIVIASGARARAIPGVRIDGERIITARHALEMEELPKSVVIVGAGPIGMEFAHLWATYGAQVTIVASGLEGASAADEDEETADLISDRILGMPDDPDRLDRIRGGEGAERLRTTAWIDPEDLARCLEVDRFAFALHARLTRGTATLRGAHPAQLGPNTRK